VRTFLGRKITAPGLSVGSLLPRQEVDRTVLWAHQLLPWALGAYVSLRERNMRGCVVFLAVAAGLVCIETLAGCEAHAQNSLQAPDGTSKGINLGGMVGHCAVRFYAMGERDALAEPAGLAGPSVRAPSRCSFRQTYGGNRSLGSSRSAGRNFFCGQLRLDQIRPNRGRLNRRRYRRRSSSRQS
jgi:hypothetical protein